MKLLIGNWKMNLGREASLRLASEIKEACGDLKKSEAWVAPSITSLDAVCKELRGSKIKVGAQNVWAPEGAFTGEVSASMLKELGCEFAIVGHSERRHVFGESVELCVKRALAGLAQGLTIVFCIGETLSERESNITEDVLRTQMLPLLRDLPKESQSKIILAYEPVWAIGTGKTANLGEIEHAHTFLQELCRKEIGVSLQVLYGGSVTPENSKEILALGSVSGALIGGASLKSDKFGAIATSV